MVIGVIEMSEPPRPIPPGFRVLGNEEMIEEGDCFYGWCGDITLLTKCRSTVGNIVRLAGIGRVFRKIDYIFDKFDFLKEVK